jgi:hypothetical protein
MPSKKSTAIVAGRYNLPPRPFGINKIIERARHMAKAEYKKPVSSGVIILFSISYR